MEQNQDLQELLALLKQNGREGQAADLSALLDYMSAMERQYAEVTRELAEVRGRISELEPKSPLREKMEKISDSVQSRLDDVNNRLNEILDSLAAWARDTLEAVKQHGVTALDKAVSLLHIRPALEAVDRGLEGAKESARTAVERAEATGHELGLAARHVRNAGYAAVGKSVKFRVAVDKGPVQSAIAAPAKAVHALLSV